MDSLTFYMKLMLLDAFTKTNCLLNSNRIKSHFINASKPNLIIFQLFSSFGVWPPSSTFFVTFRVSHLLNPLESITCLMQICLNLFVWCFVFSIGTQCFGFGAFRHAVSILYCLCVYIYIYNIIPEKHYQFNSRENKGVNLRFTLATPFIPSN